MIKIFSTHGQEKYKQQIMDILSESKIYSNPGRENVLELCGNAANVTLLKVPYFSMKSLVEGIMGKFWQLTT